LWLKRNGRSESTIKSTGFKLRFIAKNIDLDNPDIVKDFISELRSRVSYKTQLVNAYSRYARYFGISWTKPKYRTEEYLFKMPTEERIDSIIANCHLKHALEFTLMKEHGFRPIELHRTILEDIDLDRGIMSVRGAKNGRGRTVQLKQNTHAMLKTYIHKHNITLDDVIFSSPRGMSKAFQRAKKALYEKLGDPEYLKIRLYDLRHFYGTMLYYQTKDLIHVMNMMGHRNIMTTMRYLHVIDFREDQWTCKTAQNIDECSVLIEAGFEYITEMNQIKLFRKRK